MKPTCKYGINCYQRNQAHKDRFSHPPKDPPSPHPPAKRMKPSESENDSENDSKNDDDADDSDDNNKLSNSSNVEIENSSNENTTKSEHELTEPTESAVASETASARCSEFISECFDTGPHAQRAEYQKLLNSPADFISDKFLVTMPSDFFSFWEFCESQTKNNSNSEQFFKKFGLSLVGPFDVLANKFQNIESFEPGDYLRHWRFYYDPPEFQVRLLLILE